MIVQLCNCIQNHSQPTETAVARIPAAENSRFFIDTTSIELALLIEEYTCKSCAEVQLYCSSYFLTVPKLTWSIWKARLNAFAWAFTRRGFHHFAEWITAMALNIEEHTITQSVLALGQPAAWKALESFAEHGSWHQERVTQALTRLIATAPGRIWHGYQVSAVDDTKVHRSSPHVWGTCTFHEYTARCPNRAPTVRAHNWVVLGALLHEPEKPAWFLPISGRLYFREPAKPAWFLPISGRLYFRKSQLPIGPGPPAGAGHRGVPDQVRVGRRVAPRAGPHHQGQALGRFRRRLRLGERGPTAGPARRRRAPDRFPHPLAVRRSAVRLAPAPGAAPQGEAGTAAQVGSAAGAAPPGRHVEGEVAGRDRLRLRPTANNPLEGDHLPVAGAGLGGAGQGDCRLRRGIQGAVHPGDLGGGVDGAADGGVVHGAVPAGGRVPRPEAA